MIQLNILSRTEEFMVSCPSFFIIKLKIICIKCYLIALCITQMYHICLGKFNPLNCRKYSLVIRIVSHFDKIVEKWQVFNQKD